MTKVHEIQLKLSECREKINAINGAEAGPDRDRDRGAPDPHGHVNGAGSSVPGRAGRRRRRDARRPRTL